MSTFFDRLQAITGAPPPSKENNSIPGMVIVVAVGFLCTAFSLKMIYDNKSVGDRPLQATGKIVNIREGAMENQGRIPRSPEISFVTNQNQVITFTNPVYSSRFKLHIGDNITVHYSPDHPEDAKVVMPVDTAALYFLPFGLLFFLAGLKGLYDAKYKLKMF